MRTQLFASLLAAAATAPSVIAASFPNITARSTDCETSIKLFAVSDEFGKTGITNYHEGAGINYLFLTGSDSPIYTYNECTGQIYVPFDGSYKQYLNENGGLVQLTVVGPSGEFAIDTDDGCEYLSVNGDPHGWVACKNTSDPYNYSKNLYQLAYGTAGCKSIHVEVETQ